MQVTECPQCGAPASPSVRACGYCKAEFFITSVAYLGKLDQNGVGKYLKHYKALAQQDQGNAEAHLGLGITYLHLGMWPLAMKCFEKVIDLAPEVPQSYFYWALSKIGGRRLMTLPLGDVRQIETYINTAVQLSPDLTTAKLLLALLKEDYFDGNGMRVNPPSATELRADIQGKEVNETELQMMRRCVRVDETCVFSV